MKTCTNWYPLQNPVLRSHITKKIKPVTYLRNCYYQKKTLWAFFHPPFGLLNFVRMCKRSRFGSSLQNHTSLNCQWNFGDGQRAGQVPNGSALLGMNEMTPQLLVCAVSLLPWLIWRCFPENQDQICSRWCDSRKSVRGGQGGGGGAALPGSGLTDAPWRFLDESVLKLKLAAKAIG